MGLLSIERRHRRRALRARPQKIRARYARGGSKNPRALRARPRLDKTPHPYWVALSVAGARGSIGRACATLHSATPNTTPHCTPLAAPEPRVHHHHHHHHHCIQCGWAPRGLPMERVYNSAVKHP